MMMTSVAFSPPTSAGTSRPLQQKQQQQQQQQQRRRRRQPEREEDDERPAVIQAQASLVPGLISSAQVHVAEAVVVREEEEEAAKGSSAARGSRCSGRRRRFPPPRERSSKHERQDFFLSELAAGRACNQCTECPGFAAHEWRQVCTECRCPRSSHAIASQNWVFGFERLGLEAIPSGRESGNMVLDGYAWSPPGLSASRAEDWMRQLPEEKVPKLNTDGEKYRDVQLVYQSPKQDQSLDYCSHIESFHAAAFHDFVYARNDIALNVGVAVDNVREESATCVKCAKMIAAGGLAVIAPKFGPAVYWHPACFTCATCDELLVDLAHCVFDDEIFCERHYAEKLKPRCSGCDELIFSGQYTRALGKYWHCDHFVCTLCEAVLTGEKYVLGGSHRDTPNCLACFEKHSCNKCTACNDSIGLESKDIAYKEIHWHEKCFSCKKCESNLVNKPFALKNSYTFCGKCYEMEFASRCDTCGEPFRPGMKKMEYKNRKWHDKCFRCTICQASVGAKPFIIPNDKDIYCVQCFNDKFATRCTKCKEVMTTGGVTFKKEAWHRECFTCTHCGTMLAGQKFASREDKPYCAKCFGELFAKRCTKCAQPITGSGGTRFISFEDRHWHSDCFRCALCKESMAGRGFITDGEDIVCPECARNKLMGAAAAAAAGKAES